jgi:hypothetical protein
MKIFLLFLTMVAASCVYGQPERTEDMIIGSIKSVYKLSDFDKIDNIIQFNKDTLLAAGYLSDEMSSFSPKNLVFQSFDGGKHWTKHYFKGDAWIYNTHFEKDGKVWMGGSDEYIHYSTDFGSTWSVLPKPLTPANRVLSIYMADSLKGIAGGLENGLAFTLDNWKTTVQLPTPLDQHTYTITQGSSRGRVHKVQLIDSLLLIEQSEHIYFSKLYPVNWKAFNIPVRGFNVKKSDRRIELKGLSDKVYVLDTRLNQLETYTEPREEYFDYSPKNEMVDIDSFLRPGIKSIRVNAVKYVFDGLSGGCIPIGLYKKNEKELKLNLPDDFMTIKKILSTCQSCNKPMARSFRFTEYDFADYKRYLRKTKAERIDEKAWGGDYSWLVGIDNPFFNDPHTTIDKLDQSLLDTVYTKFRFAPSMFKSNEPSVNIIIINRKGEKVRIGSEYSILFSLPWTIEYGGRSFVTYDTRITDFLRVAMPEGFNYYEKLFAGELIYRLIEQRVLDETPYRNGL